MKPLIQLIYNSAATCAFNNQDLENLLRGARETNTKLDVTGMLLFVDGCFFQVLEGEEDVVDRLAEKIRLDRRHSKMSIILREPITRRVFRDWSMGLMCMSTEEAGSIEGLNDFFADGKFLTQLEAGRARTILKAFGEGRWRVRLNAAEIPQPKDSPKQVTGLSKNPKHTRTSTGDYSFAFQPIVDIRYKRVVSYEALVRGRANEPAFSVLKALSGQKLWAFDRDARRHAVRLAAELGLKTQLNLNLLPESIQAFGNEAMFDTIDAAVANGLRPEQIVLEVSESEAFPDFAIFLKLVHECRARGVKFAIDDFGAGHSGLNLPGSTRLSQGGHEAGARYRQ